MMSVILNHLYGPVLYGQLTYPFELAGFFFVAGYTFNAKDCFSIFLRGKVRSLVIPIVTLGLINAVLSFCVKGGMLLPRIAGIFIQRPGMWDDLWFVACLFIVELMFYAVLRLTSSLPSQLCICLVLLVCGYVLMNLLPVALPWHIENACIFVLFLCLGYIMKKSKLGHDIITYSKTVMARCIFLVMVIVYIVLALTFKNYPIDVHLHQYGYFVVFMLSALLGLYLVFHLSLLLERWQGNLLLRFLSFIGANTLVYYAFQSKVISLLDILGDRIGFSGSTYIGSIVYCLLTCALLAMPSYLIKRYVPFLLGKF